MKRLLTIIVLMLAACQSVASQLTADEAKKVISLAKSAALASGVLSASEEKALDSIEPVVAYYFLARPLADYSVRWKLSEEEELLVSGRGDILRLENATVKKSRPNKSPEPTPTAVTPRAIEMKLR